MEKNKESFPLDEKSSSDPNNIEPSPDTIENEENELDEKGSLIFNQVMGDIQNQRNELNNSKSSAHSAHNGDDDDDLDEDQRKALESIMSQIGDDEAQTKKPRIKKKTSTPPDDGKRTDDIIISPKVQNFSEVEAKPISPETDAVESAADDDAPVKTTSRKNQFRFLKKKKRVIGISVGIFLVTFFFIGYALWPESRTDFTTDISSDDPLRGPVAELPSPQTLAQTIQKIPVRNPQVSPSQPTASVLSGHQPSLKNISDEIDQLRSEIALKQQGIEDLRKYYQSGIDAEIKGILDVIRKSGNRTLSFQAAMNDAYIRLGLSAIQRRDTYIRQLDIPEKSLARDNAELLYFRRKAMALTHMAEKTKDIDLRPFIQQAGDVVGTNRRRLEQINIDAVAVTPASIESVWQTIAKWMPLNPSASSGPGNRPAAAVINKNEPIWKAICAGDFSKKDQLTELTPEVARCLTRWDGKDLFLNNLTALSPETAKELIKWSGNWLGLNGLKELSPESASHLSRWTGKILSLNGLSRISPQVVAALSEWQGNQIELIGLKEVPNWTNSRIQLFTPKSSTKRTFFQGNKR